MKKNNELNNFGIYQIKNIVNGKIYIGKTVTSFRKRRDCWFSKLRNNRKINQYILNEYQKYGSENFVFEIVETIVNNFQSYEEKDIFVRMREKFWIEQKKTTDRNFGYNFEKDPTVFKTSFENFSNANKGRIPANKGKRTLKFCSMCGKLAKEYYHNGKFRKFLQTCGSDECLKMCRIQNNKNRKHVFEKKCFCGQNCKLYKSTCGSKECSKILRMNSSSKICKCGNPKKKYYDKNGKFKSYKTNCGDKKCNKW